MPSEGPCDSSGAVGGRARGPRSLEGREFLLRRLSVCSLNMSMSAKQRD